MDLDSVFSHYQFDENSSPQEIIDFTVQSLQATVPLGLGLSDCAE